jgi:hypothetical protein
LAEGSADRNLEADSRPRKSLNRAADVTRWESMAGWKASSARVSRPPTTGCSLLFRNKQNVNWSKE